MLLHFVLRSRTAERGFRTCVPFLFTATVQLGLTFNSWRTGSASESARALVSMIDDISQPHCLPEFMPPSWLRPIVGAISLGAARQSGDSASIR